PVSVRAHLDHVYRRCVMTPAFSPPLVQERPGLLEGRRVKPPGGPTVEGRGEPGGVLPRFPLLPEGGAGGPGRPPPPPPPPGAGRRPGHAATRFLPPPAMSPAGAGARRRGGERLPLPTSVPHAAPPGCGPRPAPGGRLPCGPGGQRRPPAGCTSMGGTVPP